ncbi:hypothetical protein [Chitinophaga filiformis]|uniref:Uncharacterized protein n=1 Tax=Chitinophaga filiformis TaxID=104663 RepID=A0A1G7SW73_CHIFI|nr:hypothetical protein [Chitinophaga filiformis]SDG26689.1 hypothetical protein SAMN04488121_1031020 [Chitinophaga filiformis]
MKKENRKKLTLNKIKIAKLNNTKLSKGVVINPTEGPTCAVCDPMTITENVIV